MTWHVLEAPSRRSWFIRSDWRLIGTIDVLVPLEHEHAIMARVAEALNRQHMGTPVRTWTSRQGGHASWYLLHNGRECAGVVWHAHREDLAAGVERILEGLNFHASRALPAAEPAKPVKPRHLRLVS